MNRQHSPVMLIPDLLNRSTLAPGVSIAFGLLILLSTVLTFSCRPQPQPETAASPTPTPQPVSMMHPPGFGPTVLGKPYPGTGVVTTVNRKEGWVSIDHEEIKDLMPPMLMEFWVRDPSIMKGVRVGDKVDFVVVENSKGQYITEIKRVAKTR